MQTYKRSWRTDEIVLRVHVLPQLGRLYLDEVTAQSITGIVAAMRSSDYAPGTVARVVVILRYLFNLARRWNVLIGHENPAAGIPVPPDVHRNRFLTEDEMARLVSALGTDENQVAAKAILLLLLTGARRNEITHAKWDQIDFVRQTLLVPVSKTGKPRYVTLSAEALQVLNSVPRLSGNPNIFPSAVTGRPCASLHFPWVRIRKRAGLRDVRLHDLRHSFASALINRGETLYNVQKLLGHENSKSTQRYAHLAPATLSQGAGKMGGLLRPILQNSNLLAPPKTEDGSR